MVNRSSIWIVAFVLVGAVLLMGLMTQSGLMAQPATPYTGTQFGGTAPYYIPWWRRYYKESPYNHGKEPPYWNGSWYWWPYYGKNFYRNYWRGYGIHL